MSKIKFCRVVMIVILMVAATDRLAATAAAAEQKLSNLSFARYKLDAGMVVIDTTGTAKLRISFISPVMARVEIAPTGIFTVNPSPALAGVIHPIGDIAIESRGDDLVIKSSGLSLRLNKPHLRVDAYDADDRKPLTLESPYDGTQWDTATGRLQLTRVLNPAEHIYGLGQDNANRGTLDRRGTIRDMWTGQQIRSGNVTASYPVPFYLSTGRDGRGYGVFVDNVWHLRFDVGKSHQDRLTWTSPGGPIDYYIINGPSFKSVIDQYTELTGRPTMLPLYAFGYWQSRCFFNDFPDAQKTFDRLKSDGIPLDVLVIDSSWSNVDMDFLWSKKFLGGRSAKDWIAGFHADGARVMLSTKGPMIRSDSENFPEASKLGLFATDGHGKTMTTGYYGGELMDFTNPKMESWLATQLRPLTGDGIDCWWLDLIEPEGEPPQAVYFAGKSADIHNTFPLLNYRAYFNYCRQIDPASRPVILGRAASAGTQRYSGIVWTGDINSDWPTFQAHLPEAQNTGLSGLPYWTNDSGGFISGFLADDRYGAHAELYERWFEFTCFAPIARAHKAGPSEPYQYGPAVEEAAKKYLHLRYRLMPYIYNIAHEAAMTGLPMLRPLILEYQDDPASATAKTEYMFGHDMLVAPVIWPNMTARQVYFPPGQWISYDQGFEVAGGRTIGVSAPVNRIPFFVRAGTILPTAPDMMYTSEKPWDPITLEVWPAGDSTGSLYEDDKNTTAFKDGEFTATAFHCVEQAGKSVLFTISPSNGKFGPREWIAHLHLTSVPTSVMLDGKVLSSTAQDSTVAQWNYDPGNTQLTVRLPGGHTAHSIAVTLDGSSHPRPAAPQVDAPTVAESSSEIQARQIAQFLPPPKLPIRIEAANFDKGGEGLAFHVDHPSKTAVYRQEGVPIINSTDEGGGYAVPDLRKGEWLAYTVDGGEGGWFTVSARVLPSSAGELTLLRDRNKVLTTIDIPAPNVRGPAWISVAGQSLFYMRPGEQIFTARINKPQFQLGHFTFAKVKDAVVTVEAETGILAGGATIANDHEGYRGTGFAAGIGSKSSSVTVPMNVPSDGRYFVAIRYANGDADATISLKLPRSTSVTISLPATTGWDGYQEAGVFVDLMAGNNEFQVVGTGVGVANIDQFKLISP